MFINSCLSATTTTTSRVWTKIESEAQPKMLLINVQKKYFSSSFFLGAQTNSEINHKLMMLSHSLVVDNCRTRLEESTLRINPTASAPAGKETRSFHSESRRFHSRISSRLCSQLALMDSLAAGQPRRRR